MDSSKDSTAVLATVALEILVLVVVLVVVVLELGEAFVSSMPVVVLGGFVEVVVLDVVVIVVLTVIVVTVDLLSSLTFATVFGAISEEMPIPRLYSCMHKINYNRLSSLFERIVTCRKNR